MILNNYSNIMYYGRVKAGKPSQSKLYEVITASGEDRMPPYPKQGLSQEQIALITKWINQGAKNNRCTDTSCSTANVTYSGTIKPMMQTYCLGCHVGSGASGNIDLSAYTGVKTVALNGRLSGAVNHTSGYVAMPQGGQQLSSCNLKKITKWISDGAPNN